jgi:thiosulfate/3-mercaptopyruvate sulfurtransferase
MPSTYVRPEFLVGTDWLAQNLARPDIRVLDCRWRVDGSGRRLHAEGHIRESAYIDWAKDLVDSGDPLPFQLGGPEQIGATLAAAGVNNESHVVVLDDTNSLYAARVWWSLRAYGLESVSVLNGGWPAWLAAGQQVLTAASNERQGTFSPANQPRGRVAAEEVARQLASTQVQVIDARSPAEYLGQGGGGPRRGHIKGALNLPAALLVSAGSQALPDAVALQRLLDHYGAASGRRTITYDATGVGAAKLALCLELMGFTDVALYDGGWPDWAARDEGLFPTEAG